MFIRVFLVFGKPGTGKGTFCSQYCSCVKKSTHFNLDAVFLSPHYFEGSVHDIAQHIDSGELDKALFMDIFSKEFLTWYSKIPRGSIRDILIEGYELYSVEEEIRSFLRDVGVSEVVKIEINNYAFYYKNRCIKFGVGNGFDKVIDEIRSEDYNEVKPRINYQTFEDLDDKVLSRSKEKLVASGLLSTLGDLSKKTLLDVGCNNGYVCFRAADSFRRVVGIDSCSGALSIAQYLNSHIYRRESVSFYCEDFYDIPVLSTVDVIYCSSFLHYSIGENKVNEFFGRCYDLLSDSGVLVLEIELYPRMEKSILDVSGRPAGGDGSYPNLPWILEHTGKMFAITYLARSLFQPGSNYDRYFFHFTKRCACSV